MLRCDDKISNRSVSRSSRAESWPSGVSSESEARRQDRSASSWPDGSTGTTRHTARRHACSGAPPRPLLTAAMIIAVLAIALVTFVLGLAFDLRETLPFASFYLLVWFAITHYSALRLSS